MRACVVVVSLLAVLGCAHLAGAADPGVPVPVPGISIEGTLLTETGWYLQGDSNTLYWLPMEAPGAEPSPDGQYFVHGLCAQAGLYRSDADGSNRIDLTPAIGGTTCPARWSPDGGEIVFARSPIAVDCFDPMAPQPCEALFEIWLVDADGSNLHKLVSADQGGGNDPSFAPNGYCISYDGPEGLTLIDTDGTDKRVIGGGRRAEWSRDGSSLAVESREWAEEGGVPGAWHQIVLIDPLGNRLRTVFERFLPDDLTENIDYWAGPAEPIWSPRGDRILFTGANILGDEGFDLYLPWPWLGLGCGEGVCAGRGIEFYLVNADGQSPPIRLTDDDASERTARWNGPNTAADHPEVTVDNTTVTFPSVDEGAEGVTTIIRDDDPPDLPIGYQFCGEYYEISTTLPDGSYSLPITITMTCPFGDVPGGNVEALVMLHWNASTEQWEDITTNRSVADGIVTVTGETESLSPIGLAVTGIFGGFRQPINSDGSSVFKAGRTVPVKFALQDALGTPVTDAVARLSQRLVSPQILGTTPEDATAPYADAGGVFRYDAEEDQYIYNLSTKGFLTGSYELRVTVDGWPGFEKTVLIGLR